MKHFSSWKTASLVLFIFVFTTVLLPGLATQVMAADAPQSATEGVAAVHVAASDAATGIIDESESASAATQGAAAGAATSAGISGGTIALIGVVVATGIAVGLASSSDSGSSTTSHH